MDLTGDGDLDTPRHLGEVAAADGAGHTFCDGIPPGQLPLGHPPPGDPDALRPGQPDVLVPPVIDSAVDLRIDGTATTESIRGRERDRPKEVCGEAQR